MYYSKGGSGVRVPSNYSGNAFRVTDHTDRTYTQEAIAHKDGENAQCTVGSEQRPGSGRRESEELEYTHSTKSCTCRESNEKHCPAPPSILSGISAEDVLILGLVFLIHEDDPNDPALLLLLLLLLIK